MELFLILIIEKVISAGYRLPLINDKINFNHKICKMFNIQTVEQALSSIVFALK